MKSLHSTIIMLCVGALCLFYGYKTVSFETNDSDVRGINERAEHLAKQYQWSEALVTYDSIYSVTRSQLEQLIADVGHMHIYQLSGANQNYYSYRIQAEKRIKRILEERTSFISSIDQWRISNALNRYHLVLAEYEEGQSMYLEMNEALRQVESLQRPMLPDRPSLNQMEAYIIQSRLLLKQHPEDLFYLEQVDHLLQVYQIARNEKVISLMGDALLGLAEAIEAPEHLKLLRQARNNDLLRLPMLMDSIKPLYIAHRATQLYRETRQVYKEAVGLLTQGRIANQQKRYRLAISRLNRALSILGKKGNRIPLMAAIQEQLSMSYSGLDNKKESDVHRNAFLDVLESTRQNRELMARRDHLESIASMTNWLLFTLSVSIILLVLLVIWFNSHSHKRARNMHNVRALLLAICRHITGLTFQDVKGNREEMISDEKEWRHLVYKTISEQYEALHIELSLVYKKNKVVKELEKMDSIMDDFIHCSYLNNQGLQELADARLMLDKQQYVIENQIVQRKRMNNIKKTSLSILNSVRSVVEHLRYDFNTIKKEQSAEALSNMLDFAQEQLQDIILQNEVLSESIKIKKGKVNLEISKFNLQELFAIQEQRTRIFELSNRYFNVVPTDAVVKADKGLTLFMINTLVDNARKYTDEGDSVEVKAIEKDHYVEIAVEDSGSGIAASILEEVKANHQSNGFGLSNSYGIIEKYRKTSPLFSVCLFDIESKEGQGTRVYFRLPRVSKETPHLVSSGTSLIKGMLGKMLSVFIILFTGLFGGTVQRIAAQTIADSVVVRQTQTLLKRASLEADSAYYNNVKGQYENALAHSKRAIYFLNEDMKQQTDSSKVLGVLPLLALSKSSDSAEFTWWNSGLATDYYILLDIRNEAAISFLALKQFKEYQYNNYVYANLYRLVSSDRTLESYCAKLKTNTMNRTVGITLCVLVLFAIIIGYYVIYLFPRRKTQQNLELVLDIHRDLAKLAMSTSAFVYEEMLQLVFPAFDHLFNIHQLTFEELSRIDKSNTGIRAVAIDDEMALVLHLVSSDFSEEQDQLLRLLASYIGQLYRTVEEQRIIRQRDIEFASDEMERMQWESHILHVQNMLLDNTLSVFKHETLYYPTRMLQLIAKSKEGSREHLLALIELYEHYFDVFVPLSKRANESVKQMTFKRQQIPLKMVLERFQTIAHRLKLLSVECVAPNPEASLRCDRVLFEHLIESLMEGLPHFERMVIHSGDKNSGFVNFEMHYGVQLSAEETRIIFNPQFNHLHLLIAKQIIRDVDEFAGLRGCYLRCESGEHTIIRFAIPRGKV